MIIKKKRKEKKKKERNHEIVGKPSWIKIVNETDLVSTECDLSNNKFWT